MELAQSFADLLAAAAVLMPGTPSAPLQMAYQTLTGLLTQHYPAVNHAYLAARPTSTARRASVAEDLAESGASDDPAIQRAALALWEALHAATQAQPALVIGVDLAGVQAAALSLQAIQSSQRAVRVTDSTFRGDLVATDIGAGNQPPTQPPTTQLTNVAVGGNLTIAYGDGANALDLAKVEERYLCGLYAECNELTLAADGPVDVISPRQPRLQRVYVDLTTTASATPAVMRQRLVAAGVDLAQLEANVYALTKAAGQAFVVEDEAGFAKPMRMSGPNAAAHLQQRDADYWLRALRNLAAHDTDIAKQLQLEPDLLKRCLAPLTVFELLHTEQQLVLLGDPGGGKSTLTRRLAGVLASQALPALDEVEQGWLTELTACLGGWRLPVRIVLSRWAQALPATATGSADDLIDGIIN